MFTLKTEQETKPVVVTLHMEKDDPNHFTLRYNGVDMLSGSSDGLLIHHIHTQDLGALDGTGLKIVEKIDGMFKVRRVQVVCASLYERDLTARVL